MVEERYCSYEVSNLLQEKGFKQECFAKYAKEACTEKYYDDYREKMISWTIRPGELIIPSYDRDRYEVYGVMIPAPTHQMACDWIRETHNICITVYPNKEKGFEAVLYDIESDVEIILQSLGVYGFHIFENSYGKAVEAALKYALENLI